MECLLGMPYCRERGLGLINRNEAVINAAMPVAMVEAWMRYDAASPYAELIRNAKYRDRPWQARELGRIFGRDLLGRPFGGVSPTPADIDVLLPMPMHWSKEMRRGYNQSREIAFGLAEMLGAEVGDNLVAVRPHGTQTRLSHAERARNIKGCFALEHASELEGLHVAVVDDVITTGASVCEAVLALSWGMPRAASVSVLAIGATSRNG